MENKKNHLFVVLIAVVLTALCASSIKYLPSNLLSNLRGFDRSLAQSVSCTSQTLAVIGNRTVTGSQTFQTEVGCVQTGQNIYLNDPQYTFHQMPSSLSSKAVAYIKTPNAQIMNVAGISWNVQITAPSDVYVFYRKIPSAPALQPPTWITSAYTKQTPDTLSSIAPFLLRKNNNNGLLGIYDIYKLNSATPGIVNFGSALPANNSFAYSMYIVGVVGTAPTPSCNPGIDCGNDGSPNPTQTATPTRTASPTQTATPTSGPTAPPSVPPISGDFPCGKFPNAGAGCMPVSYQSWFDNVPASATTMSVSYTPRLLHQHYECNVPQTRANGQGLKQAMKIPCQFVKYNSIVPSNSGNSGWFRSQNQGSTYEQFTMNLSPCQSTKYEGKECKTENVHTVRASDFSKATEMRYTPNAKFTGMGGQRHYLSSNWQTGIGYRSSSELTTRYWIGECGNYQRLIMPTVDKFMKGSEPIPTVRGTITIPFESNGGCGTQFKTFAFLDPGQHVATAGNQKGTTLMETNGHFKGNLTWDTTNALNGVHSVLFINLEGTGSYVAAAGISLRYNVQN
ncbi:MAG: hypothetical protein M3Q44_03320 [bacterium]|nr:hypothetical protein [bacterium]